MFPKLLNISIILYLLPIITHTSPIPFNINNGMIDPILQSELEHSRGEIVLDENTRKIKSVFNVPILTTTELPVCPQGMQRVSSGSDCVLSAPRVSTGEVFLFSAIKNYYSTNKRQGSGAVAVTTRPPRPSRRRPTRSTTIIPVVIMTSIAVETSTVVNYEGVSELPTTTTASNTESHGSTNTAKPEPTSYGFINSGANENGSQTYSPANVGNPFDFRRYYATVTRT